MFDLKWREVFLSKMLVNLQKAAWRNMPEYSAIRHNTRRKNCKYHIHEDLSYPDNVTFNGCKCWIHLNLENGAAVAYSKK
jgi:hypothetical protein